MSALFRRQNTANQLQIGPGGLSGTLQQQFWRIRNDFHFIPAPRGRHTWNYKFSVSSRRTPESLQFSPTELIHVLENIKNGTYVVGQDVTHSHHWASTSINYLISSRIPWFRQNYVLDAHLGQEDIQSGLWTDDRIPVAGTSFKNELDWQQYQLQLSANYSFHFDRLMIQTKVPVSWLGIYLSDQHHDLSDPYGKLQIMPTLNLRYTLSARQNLQATYYRLQQTGRVWDVYRGAVVTDYRTQRASRSVLPYVIRDLAEVKYSIENIAHMLFTRFGYRYGSTYSNIMDTRRLDDEQTGIGSVSIAHRVHSHAANVSLSKFVQSLNGQVSLLAEIEQHQANQLFNNETLLTSTRVISVQPNLSAQLFRKVKLSYEGEFLWNRTSAAGLSGHLESSASSSNRLEGVYSIGGAWHFKATARHFHVGMKDFSYSQLMLDGNIRYKSSRTKLEYECILSNITNVQELQYSLVNDNYVLQKHQQLRGRMVLVKIGFNF